MRRSGRFGRKGTQMSVDGGGTAPIVALGCVRPIAGRGTAPEEHQVLVVLVDIRFDESRGVDNAADALPNPSQLQCIQCRKPFYSLRLPKRDGLGKA